MFFEFGDIKDDIKKVQNRLEALGYFNEEKSGYYGEVTQKAVKAFQKANKLTQSGNCDYKTLTLMFSAKAKAARLFLLYFYKISQKILDKPRRI